MELSRTLEEGAHAAIAQAEGEPTVVPIEGTPFYLSKTGEGLISHGVVDVDGVKYYVGTLDTTASAA